MDNQEAIYYGQLAVDHWPGSADINALFGSVLISDGQYERRLAQLRRAMRLSPHFPTWYLTMAGRSLVGMGEFQEAISTFDEALKRDPVDIFLARTLAGKAEALRRLGDREQALRVIDTLRHRVPWYTLGYMRDDLQYKDQKVVEEKIAVMRELGLPEYSEQR